MHLSLSILTHSRSLDIATEHEHHELRTIAQPQHRDPQLKQFLCVAGRILLVATVWSARQYDPLRIHCLNLFDVCLVGIDLAIYIAFPDTPCHKLVVLTAEIDDDDLLIG